MMQSSVNPNSDRRSLRVAVVGGGITGLSAAYTLAKSSKSDQRALQVTLFEASRRLGGIIRTEEADGFLMELGPDSFITNKPGGVRLCEELGYSTELISTDSRYRRSLVLSRGRPQPVPDGFMLMAPEKPWSLLTSPVLSLPGRLRLLAEYFVPGAAPAGDESLASFVRRRFGSEALDRLVQPLVGGIYTSDPERLSLRATMPRFPEMEAACGSVIRGVLKQKHTAGRGASEGSGSGARYGLFATPRRGLGDLVSTLERRLRTAENVRLQLGTPIQAIHGPAQGSAEWVVQTEGQQQQFDAVIVTLSTWLAAKMLQGDQFLQLRQQLNSIEYASSALVVSGHLLSDFTYPMDAFGMVVPACERRQILAVSFSSRKFPERAPDGQIVLRTFVGGAMQPELMQHSDQELLEIVNSELQQIFGMSREPIFAEVMRYDRAMPQYHVGHLDRVAAIEHSLQQHTGLQLAGSGYRGVGIPDSIDSGREAAERVLRLF
ncbi:MAG: protoporphyrinogen oxidase [Planctomyces sp.]